MSTEPANSDGIFVTSGYGANTRQPFVSLRIGDRAPIQIRPAEARDLALNLLEGAEAADQDAFMIRFFMEQCGLSLEDAGRMLMLFRESREGGR